MMLLKTTVVKTVFFGLLMLAAGCSKLESQDLSQQEEITGTSRESADADYTAQLEAGHKVTFIELGSVKCIPCIKMAAVMEEIEQEFGDQVKIVFYDVWTPQGKPYAQQYAIRVIPTQVFLDREGNEYFRHEGFFPKEKLVSILRLKGVR
ncbi:MAG: thioredoxin fold domain-containing protein [Spirochaeta sp.]|nr:thioredoxin fold domain-containing protein [Spirochaeta sp.]